MRAAVVILAAALATTVLGAPGAPRALTLDEAVALALEQNPDLATARQRIAAARAGLQQADAAFWPRVRLGGTYVASDHPVQVFMMTLNQRAFDIGGADFNDPDTTDNLNAKALVTYALYNGGRDVATRQAARLGVEAQEQNLAAARNDLVFEVTRAFHAIGKARQFRQTAETTVTSMEANLQVAADRVEQGQALQSDRLDAEVRLAEAREDLIRAGNALALAETVFRHVLGVGATTTCTAANSALHGNDRSHEVQNAETGIGGRPELVAAQQAVAIADRRVRAAQAGHWPRVNAFASYDLDSGNARDYQESWLAGVSVELDVFDGFLTRGQVAEARAGLAAAREQLRKIELVLQLEWKQAQLNLAEAQARLDTTARAVAQAEESLRITKDRYGNGLALLTQLLDAETALTAARHRRTAAEADALIAAAALARAQGTIGKETE